MIFPQDALIGKDKIAVNRELLRRVMRTLPIIIEESNMAVNTWLPFIIDNPHLELSQLEDKILRPLMVLGWYRNEGDYKQISLVLKNSVTFMPAPVNVVIFQPAPITNLAGQDVYTQDLDEIYKYISNVLNDSKGLEVLLKLTQGRHTYNDIEFLAGYSIYQDELDLVKAFLLTYMSVDGKFPKFEEKA